MLARLDTALSRAAGMQLDPEAGSGSAPRGLPARFASPALAAAVAAAWLAVALPVRAQTPARPPAPAAAQAMPPVLLPASPQRAPSHREPPPAPNLLSGLRSAAAAGQGAAALGMQEAVNRAVRWHPSLHNARSQLLQQTESIEAARSGYYPTVTAGVSSQASNNPIGDTDSQHQHLAQISVTQMVYDFGKVGSQVDQAMAASGAARAQVLLTFDQVIRNTAEAWVEVSRNEALVEVAKQQVASLEALTKLVKERQDKGAGTYSDTAQAQARVDEARVELLTAQSQVRLWRTTLMHWVGMEMPPQIAGAPTPALKGTCEADAASRRASVQSTAAVQVAQSQLEQARAGLDLAEAQLRPTLSVSGSVGRRLGGDYGAPGTHRTDASVMLNFSMPLYEGGRLQSGKRAAGYGVSAATAALDQARLDAIQGLQNAVLQWRKYSGRIQVQAAREANMRITRVLYRQQYLQLGTRSMLDLLNAEQEYYSSLNDQIESKHEMYHQEIECLYYMGGLRNAFSEGEVVSHAISAPNLPSQHVAGEVQ